MLVGPSPVPVTRTPTDQAMYYVMTHVWPVSQPEALALSGRLAIMRFGRHNR